MASADAAGFIFNWEFFVVDPDLTLGSPNKKISIKDSTIADISLRISEDSKDIFALTPDQNNYSTSKAEKKAAPGNIKINLFQTSKFMTIRDKTYTNNDDEQLSKIISDMTSLIYGDSKIKSLQTIGKIIEPQVNFYFEF